MGSYVLAAVDASGIQNYVFGTNSLKQNTGASFLVNCATRDWALRALPEKNNIQEFDHRKMQYTSQEIETDSDLEAEVIFSGGGNFVVLFRDETLAKDFAWSLSSKVQMEAPGLHIIIEWVSFEWEKSAIGGEDGVFQQLMKKIAKRKLDPIQYNEMPGLGVTAQCIYTGMPATGVDEGKLVSAEVQAKLDHEKAGHERLTEMVDLGDYKELPKQFDEIGQGSEESNYIAIVHTDGNNMGRRRTALLERYDAPKADNRACVDALRSFSISVQKASIASLQTLINTLRTYSERNNVQNDRLPFRPIVFGGDDSTFVCSGELGLALAARHLQALSEHTLLDRKPLYCHCGVAIVKTHYPFSRAYALAEELSRTAKEYILASGKEISALDWHVATAGIESGLREIRDWQYHTKAGNLLMRPIQVAGVKYDWRNWETFSELIEAFQSEKFFGGHRNQLYPLEEALRKGKKSVAYFLATNNADIRNLPEIHTPEDIQFSGWKEFQEARCAYYDAIEAFDFYIALPSKEG